jgi:hypothetical protein
MKTEEEIEIENHYLNILPELTRVELEKRYMELYSNNLKNDVKNLRDDLEKHTESLDLIKDSDIIQIYGSIIGRLNLILKS